METNQVEPQTAVSQQVSDSNERSMVVRIPKPNIQVAALALIALITLFQTFQLVRINSATASSVRTAPVPTNPAGAPNTSPSGSGSVPQSMVGGC